MNKLANSLAKEKDTSPDTLMATWLQWLCFVTFLLSTILIGSIFVNDTQSEMGWWFTGSFALTLIVVPYKPYQKWLKTKCDKLLNFANNLFKGLFTVGVALVIGYLVLWGGWKAITKLGDFIIPDKWTLMVCDEKLNNYECYSNSDVIPGFDSKKDCLLEGARNFSSQGYECGSNCKDDYGLFVCKEICNQGGCYK